MKNSRLRLAHTSGRQGKRGAALILEIIIYLVIVALIAVAVTSGVRAIRDLVFTSHAKGDVRNVQTWAEGKYAQDNVYPHYPTLLTAPDAPTLTTANNVTNTAKIASVNGAESGYCIVIGSGSISDTTKRWFWVSSVNPAKIMQSNTASNPSGAGVPPSGIPGVTCP